MRSTELDASRLKHPGTKFFWFKYACTCSWLIIALNFLMFCTAWAALAKLSGVEKELCTQPEVTVDTSNATDCRPWFRPFSNCLDGADLIGSVQMRECLLGDTDHNAGPLIDDAATYASATMSYRLAQRYEGAPVDVDLARVEHRLDLGGAVAVRRFETDGGEPHRNDAVGDVGEVLMGGVEWRWRLS